MSNLTYFDKWLIDSFGGSSPKEAISLKVSELLSKSKQYELPIKLSSIAKIIGINPYPIYRDQLSWGELIKINNEFRISLKMKSGKPPSIFWYGYPKLRFTYAHELIHCFFYDFSFSPPKRIAPYATRNEEEEICNYGASLLILPESIVRKFIDSLNSKDFIYKAEMLSSKAKVSLQASFIHLINNNYLKERNKKLYILSSIHSGYRNRGIKKPRCIISTIFDKKGEKNIFIPTYKGIEIIGNSWSLLNFFNNNLKQSELFVKNEIIKYKNTKYILNGTHKKFKGNYVWSDLSFETIK